MNEEKTIKVLWIDDLGSKADDDFFEDVAAERNIEITNVVTVDEGISLLTEPNSNFDAIILDINCYREDAEKEEPHASALSFAIQKIMANHIDLPYFVYSAMDSHGLDIVRVVVHEINPWDNRFLYHKPRDMQALFDAIRKAVEENPDFKLRKKYARFMGITRDYHLLSLLRDFEKGDIMKDIDYSRKFRPLLEQIALHLDEKGLVPLGESKKMQGKERSANIVKDCSVYLGLENHEAKYVPKHIKRLFHLLSECFNECMHEGKTPKMIERGESPWLNTIMTYGLLEILSWVKQIDKKSEDADWLKAWKRHFQHLSNEKNKKNETNGDGKS